LGCPRRNIWGLHQVDEEQIRVWKRDEKFDNFEQTLRQGLKQYVCRSTYEASFTLFKVLSGY
jgi:hypothetical protein